jgi:hypothetical protein
MQTNSVSRDVIAHHEAGHAVAGLVLGVPFTEVRIVPAENGKIGVPLKTNPWTGPRPASNPGEFADEEWAELSRSDEGWEAWKKRDNDSYAIFCLAGKAAQLECAGEASEEDAKADYSLLPIGFPIASGASVNWSRRPEPWSESIGRRCRPSLRSFSIDRSYLRPRPRRSSSGPRQRACRKVMGDSNGSACREGRSLRLVKLVASRIVSTESEPRPLRGVRYFRQHGI